MVLGLSFFWFLLRFFAITLIGRLHIGVDLLLRGEKHLHVHVISLRGEVLVHKISLITLLFIEVPVPNQESEQSCICMLSMSIFDFRIVPTVWYFFHFIFILFTVLSIYHQMTASDYPFGIFITASDYPFGIIITASDYLFAIFS